MNTLLKFYSDEGPERVGYIIADTDELVEVENVAGEPEKGFEVTGADILKYMYVASGTWHSHPGKSRNLSMGDYDGFQNFKNMDHYIVGNDGIARYYFDKDENLCQELL